MTPREFLMRLTRRIGPLARKANDRLRKQVEKPGGIPHLNRNYKKLKGDELALYQSLHAKAFTGFEPEINDSVWEVTFGGETIKLPIRRGKMWLDWDNAVSIIGHDREVKQTYEYLLSSEFKPKVFFDVGANYGTHSLLFLKHGVTTVAFEPNPYCLEEIRGLWALNNVVGELIPAAVGDCEGEAEFWFPLRETWLGSLVESTRERMTSDHDLEKIKVKINTLDDFVSTSELVPDLIKIDTEGNELNVLLGAKWTIARARPIIIFEANNLTSRSELWKIFKEFEYSIFELPFDCDRSIKIGEEAFLSSSGTNFVAASGRIRIE